MTYKELAYAYHILTSEGYVKQEKPMWDMDFYRILNKVNKDISTYEETNDR